MNAAVRRDIGMVRNIAAMLLCFGVLIGCGESSVRDTDPLTRDNVPRAGTTPLRPNFKILPTINHGSSVKSVLPYDGSSGIISLGDDGAIKFWDAGTYQGISRGEAGQNLMSFKRPCSPVIGVSEGTNVFMTWHEDKFVRLWEVDKPHIPAASLAAEFPHDFEVKGAIWFDFSSMLISWDEGGNVHLWTMEESTPKTITHTFHAAITQVHRYGRLLFVETVSEKAYVLDLRENDAKAVLTHEMPLTATSIMDANFLADVEPHLYSVTQGGAVTRWNAPDYNNRDHIFQMNSREAAYKFHGNGKYLAALSGLHDVEILDLEAQTPESVYIHIPEPLFGFAMPQSESWHLENTPRIVTWHEGGIAKIWNAATGVQISHDIIHGERIRGAVFVNYSRHLVTWGDDGLIKFHDVTTAYDAAMVHKGYVTDARFSHDESIMATSGGDGRLFVWDAKTGQKLSAMKHGGQGLRNEIFESVFSPDNRRIATRNRNGSLKLWDVQSGKQIGKTIKTQDVIGHMLFTKDGAALIFSSHDGSLWSISAETGELNWRRSAHPDKIFALALSPDQTMIATGGNEGAAMVWSTHDGEKLAELPHDDGVFHVAFLNDSRALYVSDYGRTAKIWNLRDTTKLLQRFDHGNRILTFQFTQDESRLLTAGMEGIRIWDAENGELLMRPDPENDATVLGAVFSPDERHILSWDDRLMLWDSQTGKQVFEVSKFHSGRQRFTCAEFSPDGRFILASSAAVPSGSPGDVRLYSVETGEQVGITLYHGGYVYCAAFSKDGRKILSYAGGAAKLWDISWVVDSVP